MNLFAISGLLIILSSALMAVFVFWKSKDKATRILWPFLCICTMLWGVITYKTSTVTSIDQALFWWNLLYIGPIFVPVIFYHFIYSFLKLSKKINKYILVASYFLALFFTIISLIFPKVFFGNLTIFFDYIYSPIINPKNIVFFIFYFTFYWALLSYAFWQLILAFKNSTGILRNQLKYFLLGSAVGWAGPHGFFVMAANINIYPYSNFLLIIYPIIFAYAILKYQLMDISIIIKKAFFYSIGIALAVGLMVGVSFLSGWLTEKIPFFRYWTIPLVAGFVAFVIGRIFWHKSKEVDKLKYEFITVAAHKLRTPLTKVKWALEALSEEVPGAGKKLISEAKKANAQTIELTDELLTVSKADADKIKYQLKPADLEMIAQDVINDLENQIRTKNIKLVFNFEKNLPRVNVDQLRISSVIQILLENAILYTKDEIKINIDSHKDSVVLHIEDNGIGIKKEDQPYIFSRFYRSHEAYLTETEGTGIGLFLAKSMIDKHDGTIGVRSEGKGKGSIFWFKLPVV